MNISLPRERRPDENRVGLTPAGVELLTAAGHHCFVETNAGLSVGFSDDDFARAGAHVVYSTEEVYGRAEVVVKVARPTADELPWLREGQTVLAFWHIASASPDNLETLRQKKITAIAYESIQMPDGTLPVLRSMSQIAGRMVVQVAGSLLQNDRGGRGILLGGEPGIPPAQVVILGAGVVGTNAARAFHGLGATVYVLDRDLLKLERLTERCGHVITMVSHPFNIRKVVRFADVLVGAVLVPGQRTPLLVTREMVRTMRPRSVVIDVAIDEGGCVETARPTTHRNPTYIEEGVIHYCVPNIAGVVGRTATHALNNATWPFVQLLAGEGVDVAIKQDLVLARGVVTHAGQVVAKGTG
jgi:alanine dehydrogenase